MSLLPTDRWISKLKLVTDLIQLLSHTHTHTYTSTPRHRYGEYFHQSAKEKKMAGSGNNSSAPKYMLYMHHIYTAHMYLVQAQTYTWENIPLK